MRSRIPTKQEFLIFLQTFDAKSPKQREYSRLIQLIALLGLRWSEMFRITVRNVLQRHFEILESKKYSARGKQLKRKVVLTGMAHALAMEQISEFCDIKEVDSYIFEKRSRTAGHYFLKNQCKKAGIDTLGFNSFRKIAFCAIDKELGENSAKFYSNHSSVESLRYYLGNDYSRLEEIQKRLESIFI